MEDHSVRVLCTTRPSFTTFTCTTPTRVDIGVQAERAHLLDDVIDNIERDSEHTPSAP